MGVWRYHTTQRSSGRESHGRGRACSPLEQGRRKRPAVPVADRGGAGLLGPRKLVGANRRQGLAGRLDELPAPGAGADLSGPGHRSCAAGNSLRGPGNDRRPGRRLRSGRRTSRSRNPGRTGPGRSRPASRHNRLLGGGRTNRRGAGRRRRRGRRTSRRRRHVVYTLGRILRTGHGRMGNRLGRGGSLVGAAGNAGGTGRGRRTLGEAIGGRRGRRAPVRRLRRNRFGPIERTLAAARGIFLGRLGELHPPRPLLAPGGLHIGEVAGIGMLDLPVVLPEQGEPAPGVDRTQHGLDQERIEGVHHDLRYRVGQAPGSEARSERIAGRLAVGDRRHQVVAAGYRKTAQERRSRG